MNEETITGAELSAWRSTRKLSLREVAEMLGVTSPSTISAWEDGQTIPGPAQLLLGWLIHGKVPFGQEGEAAGRLASAAWKVEMTLEAFKKLEAKAMAAGYEDLVDYIAQLVLEDLAEEDAETRRHATAPADEMALLADVPSTEPVPARQAVVYPKKPRNTGGKKQ